MISSANKIEIPCDANVLKYRAEKPLTCANNPANSDRAKPRTSAPVDGIAFVYDLYRQSSPVADEALEFLSGVSVTTVFDGVRLTLFDGR